MSLKNWLLLLCLYLLYLVLGMMVFHNLECPHEKDVLKKSSEKQWKKAIEILETISTQMNHENKTVINLVKILDSDLHPIYEKCVNLGKSGCVYNHSATTEKCPDWDLYNSFFFSFTAVTTIGYGHIFPKTKEGMLACIFYCLVGVPLNAILIGTLGNFFSIKVIQLKNKLSENPYSGNPFWELKSLHVVSRVIVEGTGWILVGTLLFMFIPATIFHLVEGQEELSNHHKWEYIDTLYYTFITLSTIGFGDMVAARQGNEEYNKVGIITWIYNVCIITWILLGMGYIFMIVNVISEAIKSTGKPVKKVISNIKKQIQYSDYWRNIIGELMIIKNWHDDDGSIGSLMNGIMSVESQPCLGDGTTQLDQDINQRKVKSTGDLQSLSGLESTTASPARASQEVRRSTHSLYIPDNELHIPDTIQELNEDTIHSLREFLTANNHFGGVGGSRDWISNNVSSSAAPTRPVSRQLSKKSARVSPMLKRTRNVAVKSRNISYNSDQSDQDQSDPGYPPVTSGHSSKRRLNHRLKRANSSVSSKSARSGSSHKSQISNLLEQTTLAQFLEAAETVRKRSMLDLSDIKPMEITKAERKRSKSCFGHTRQETQTIQQLSSMMTSLKTKNDAKYGPLIQDSPSSSKNGSGYGVPSIVVTDSSPQAPWMPLGRFKRSESTPRACAGTMDVEDPGKTRTPLGRFERRASTPRASTRQLVGEKTESLSPAASTGDWGDRDRGPI